MREMTNRGLSLVPACYLDDRGRDRCESDDKIAYPSERAAMEAAAARRQYINKNLTVYKAEPCGHWHMTSAK